ncbi:Regulatory protein RecX [compost metagenome]
MTIQLEAEDDHQEENVLAEFPDGEELSITKVEREPRSGYRYLLHFGPYRLSVHEDIMIKYRMITGRLFTKAELEEVVLADEKQRAYVEGLRYLERKPRTAMEMTRRLRQKEIGETVIEEVLGRLIRERLIDDDQYARQWAEQRVTAHRRGKLWVRQELRGKGIAKETIAEALGEISPEQEKESAMQLGAKKWNTIRGDLMDKRRKTGAFLMRRGYSGEIVRVVLNSLKEDEADAGEFEDLNEFE